MDVVQSQAGSHMGPCVGQGGYGPVPRYEVGGPALTRGQVGRVSEACRVKVMQWPVAQVGYLVGARKDVAPLVAGGLSGDASEEVAVEVNLDAELARARGCRCPTCQGHLALWDLPRPAAGCVRVLVCGPTAVCPHDLGWECFPVTPSAALPGPVPALLQRLGQRWAVLPVVHLKTPEQGVEEVRKAVDAGAQGAFLIDHAGCPSGHYLTREAYSKAAEQVPPGFLLGVNLLGADPRVTFSGLNKDFPGLGALWVDDAGIEEDAGEQAYAKQVTVARRYLLGRGARPLYFGGVAHKGGRRVWRPEQAARHAVPYLDVVTTSGPRTGEACAARKVENLRNSLGPGFDLGLASGVSEHNAAAFLRAGATCFLVASSVALEGSFHQADPTRLRRLVEVVRDAAGEMGL